MPILRVDKVENFTAIDNNIFMNKDLSLKAKGLVCQMLSLPDRWKFSVAGLASLAKDGKDSVMTALRELETAGYLTKESVREGGKFAEIIYTVHENPHQESPHPGTPHPESPALLNTNKSNTNKSNTNINIPPKPPRGGKKVPPTLEEVREYARSRGSKIDPDYFFDYYEGLNWMRGKTKVKDWQATYRTWERRSDAGPKGTETNKNYSTGNGIDYNQFIDVQ